MLPKNAEEISIQKLLLVIFSIVLIPVILSQVLIRHVYTDWLEPESTAGTIMLTTTVVNEQLKPTKKNILIIGDSRIGEGFSSIEANKAAAGTDYNFVSLGLAGTTPRVWSYLLKKIDPNRNKFYAIYVMTTALSDNEIENLSNRSLDTSYLSAIFELENIKTYPQSFENEKLADEAMESILFPASALQNDIFSFIKSPIGRIKKTALWKRDYGKWILDYSGRTEQLPPLQKLEESNIVLEQLHEPARNEMAGYFGNAAMCENENIASFKYKSKWYGDISSYYDNTAVTVGVFLIPRGPYHNLMTCDPTEKGSLKVLIDKQKLTLIAPKTSLSLEKPEYFFDHLHLNHKGRNIFSTDMATDIINSLKDL